MSLWPVLPCPSGKKGDTTRTSQCAHRHVPPVVGSQTLGLRTHTWGSRSRFLISPVLLFLEALISVFLFSCQMRKRGINPPTGRTPHPRLQGVSTCPVGMPLPSGATPSRRPTFIDLSDRMYNQFRRSGRRRTTFYRSWHSTSDTAVLRMYGFLDSLVFASTTRNKRHSGKDPRNSIQ